MIRIKVISFASIVMLAIFSVALYTSSCNKDACVGVTCFNNAPCKNGSCTCPPGFTGAQCATRNVTNIIYQNNSQTYVTISVNSSTGSGSNTIPVGGTFVVTGNYGSSSRGSASTYGFSSSPGQTVTWNLNDTFPATGSVTVPLNVPSTYFFLYIINNSPNYYVTQAVVNYDLSTQATITGLDIYNSSGAYPAGYFRSSPTPNVVLSDYSTYTWPTINFTLPDTVNQSYTAIVH